VTLAIVDADAGNLRSLRNAIAALGLQSRILAEPPETRPNCVILPGVGAFGHVAGVLRERGWADWLPKALGAGTRVVGICLGMQLLFERSEESPGEAGLGILLGSVRRLRAPKVPHIGWAPVRPTSQASRAPALAWAYFAHGYVAEPTDPSVVTAWSRAGEEIPASVGKGNAVGVQFHPEKSQQPGLDYLRYLVGVTQ
jgi:glutamine amidotransferase